MAGIDNGRSRYYIGAWRGDSAKLGASGARILKAAERITRTILDK